MDSSFEMFNRTSYFPIYSYPSEISSFRSNNNLTTTDHSSYYPDNTLTVYTNSQSHSPNTTGISLR
jgi:hypothetical protein